MLNDAKDLQAVYIVCGYTDLRKGIDSLLNIISQTYGMDPFQPGTLFMFCGREYSYAAEPPVQFRLSHLSRRSEPL